MLQIHMNGLTRDDPSGPQNWGELLDLLENGHAGARQIVTAVRFSGVAVPTFRELPTLARALGEVGEIEVETATVEELLRESAQAAYDSIAPLRNAVRRVAERLRDGNPRTASRDLPELTASVQTLTGVTAMLAGARELIGAHRTDFDALVQRLCVVVDSIIASQSRSNWLAVASVLEDELMPTLAAWASVVRRIWVV